MSERLPIPPENVAAAFPTRRRVGKAVLRPIAIGDVIALSHFHIDIGEIKGEDALFVAYVLSQPDCDSVFADGMSFKLLSRRVKGRLKDIQKAVNEQVTEALSTFVPGRSKKRMGGCGWPLELAEFLMSEYGYCWGQALDTPLATAFALLTVARARNGGEHAGPDYIERQKAREMLNG